MVILLPRRATSQAPPVVWMPAGLLMAAALGGLHYGFRGIAIVSGLASARRLAADRRPGLSFALIAALLLIFAFLIQSADERQQTAAGRRGLL